MRKLSMAALFLTLLVPVSAGAVDMSSAAFCPPNSTVTASVFQRFVHLNDDSGAAENYYNPTAGAVAYAYTIDNWTAGVALSYEEGNRRYNSNNAWYWTPIGASGAKIRDQTVGANLFATYKTPTGWYGSGSAFVGYNETKLKEAWTTTPWGVNNYSGDSEDHVRFAASVEAGKVFDLSGALAIKPHVGFDYAYLPGVSYNFSNVLANPIGGTLSAGHQNFYEIPVGVGLSKSFDAGSWVITPNLDLTLVNSVGKMDNLNFYPGFSTYNGTDWKTYGIAGGHTGGRITAGLDAKLNNRFDVGVDYTFEGRKDYTDHRVSATVGLSF